MSEIFIIGINGDFLPPDHLQRIRASYAVVVSRRFEPLLPEMNIKRIPIAPVSGMVQLVGEALVHGDVAVLASGDPLFFGIGRTLLRNFGPEQVRIYPALSAMQLACARFKIPWDDLAMMSLHGRDPQGIAGRVLAHPRVMLFTDHRNSPDRIARLLLERLAECGDHGRMASVRVRVAENLGLSDERLSAGSLEETAEARFGPLNMMLVEQDISELHLPVFGLGEGEIRHSRGLITKDEVRSVVLHCLRLPERGVFWDVGGGSGSVSVAAARLVPELDVFTVEKKDEGLVNIRKNIQALNLYNIRAIAGQAPDALAALPDPDRVFIGGSGGRLAEIIRHGAGRLVTGGKMVATAVLEKTARQAPRFMREAGLEVDIRVVRVTRFLPQGEEKNLNPITIITGTK
jgi:precorrin-6Y C5,15-methyltransferase (decarboxylating)